MIARKVLTFSLMVILIAFMIPPVQANWVYVKSIYNGTFTISPLTYSHITARHVANQKIAIDFKCIGAETQKINFLICDAGGFRRWESAYDHWELYGSFTGYIEMRGVVHVYQTSSWEGEFQIPYDGTWFYVLFNPFTGIKTVQLTIDIYQWLDPLSIWVGMGVLVSGIITVILGVIQRSKSLPK